MKRAYCRCNGGDYFTGIACPFDGWSSAASEELHRAVTLLDAQGMEPSMSALREAGVTDESMKRVIIVEFGSPASSFQALKPDAYVVNDKWQTMREVGWDLM